MALHFQIRDKLERDRKKKNELDKDSLEALETSISTRTKAK